MKTPEEWASTPHLNWGQAYRIFISQIQLDAWRQGMTDAAALAYNPLSPFHNPTTAHDRFAVKKAILAARDAKGTTEQTQRKET